MVRCGMPRATIREGTSYENPGLSNNLLFESGNGRDRRLCKNQKHLKANPVPLTASSLREEARHLRLKAIQARLSGDAMLADTLFAAADRYLDSASRLEAAEATAKEDQPPWTT